MATAVVMPKLGESVVEGTVARWLKAPGEAVAKLEPLLEISTDKIDTEVPAPAGGVLLAIEVQDGRTVAAGTVLGYIGAAGEEPPVGERGLGNGAAERGEAAPAAQKEAASVGKEKPAQAAQSEEKAGGRGFVSPVVARMAAEHQLDLAQVAGTGMGGRVTKKDVEAFLARQAEPREAETDEERKPAPAAAPAGAPPGAVGPDEVLQPLTAMRRAIAQHMVLSKQTSPHVTTIFEADMTAVVRHREAHKARYADKGIHLTYTPYFVAAAAAALKAVPQANSRYTAEGIVLRRRIHICVAVAVEQGLLTPVVRDADEKNLQGLARAVNDLAERGRGGKLLPDELAGGTFTVTNHGTGGSLIGTPIINPPQAGMLGVGAIVKRPVVRSATASLLPNADDAIVIRPMCYLSLTFDHRILDGAGADAFLAVVKESLESWNTES